MTEQTTCPICQNEIDYSGQCTCCDFRFKVLPPADNKKLTDPEFRLEGYLISDIKNCLVQNEPDIIERFRNAGNKSAFNHDAGLRGMFWFSKRGMLDISLWIIAIDILAVFLIAVVIGFLNRGYQLPDHTTFGFTFSILLTLFLNIFPCGRFGDLLLWKHTKAILDFYGCKDRPNVENPELKKKLALECGVSSWYILVSTLYAMFVFFSVQMVTLIFLYFGYIR